MQPNQQNTNNSQGQPPAPNGYVSPTGANVPEYLHMEPVVDSDAVAKKRERRLKIVLLVALLVTVIVAIVGGVFLYVQHNSPQASFYRVLEKQMQISRVLSKIEVTTKNSQKTERLDINSESDFSNTSNYKTKLNYSLSRSNKTEKDEVSGSLVMIDSTVSSILTKAPYLAEVKSLSLNSWYLIDVSSTKSRHILDPIGLYDNYSSPLLDYIVIGNLPAAMQDEAMTAIRSSVVYEVKDRESATTNGNKKDIYDVTIDLGKLSKLNETVAKSMKLPLPSNLLITKNAKATAKIHVDSESGHMTKIELTTKSGEYTQSLVQTLEYPSTVKVDKPTSDTKAVWK